jgi:hypothetical protein
LRHTMLNPGNRQWRSRADRKRKRLGISECHDAPRSHQMNLGQPDDATAKHCSARRQMSLRINPSAS